MRPGLRAGSLERSAERSRPGVPVRLKARLKRSGGRSVRRGPPGPLRRLLARRLGAVGGAPRRPLRLLTRTQRDCSRGGLLSCVNLRPGPDAAARPGQSRRRNSHLDRQALRCSLGPSRSFRLRGPPAVWRHAYRCRPRSARSLGDASSGDPQRPALAGDPSPFTTRGARHGHPSGTNGSGSVRCHGRVRARADPRADASRTRVCEGPRSSGRQTASALNRASSPSQQDAGSWRAVCGDRSCPGLLPSHHLPMDGGCGLAISLDIETTGVDRRSAPVCVAEVRGAELRQATEAVVRH